MSVRHANHICKLCKLKASTNTCCAYLVTTMMILGMVLSFLLSLTQNIFFGPDILFIYGLMHWWVQFRHFDIYRRSVACFTGPVKHLCLFCTLLMYCSVCKALPGVNAAAVGLIVAVVFQLGMKVRVNSPFSDATVCIDERSHLHLKRPFCMPNVNMQHLLHDSWCMKLRLCSCKL